MKQLLLFVIIKYLRKQYVWSNFAFVFLLQAEFDILCPWPLWNATFTFGGSQWLSNTDRGSKKQRMVFKHNFRRLVDISENIQFLSASIPRCNMPGLSPPFCCLSLILFSNQVMASALVSSASSRTTKGVNEETSLSENDKPSCIFPDPCVTHRREEAQGIKFINKTYHSSQDNTKYKRYRVRFYFKVNETPQVTPHNLCSADQAVFASITA